ncbi:DUF2894 domain-containing protein [Paraburkholderia sp. NMBU_R16]|uniref:DUF2894 domain-containing protein n=1 Tax=Paraburkholderia sp. NMBU_R16 TaxID=2698676 RepID=UPI0015672734|nr:DUF2894 domain-containing protein [Paraburkholderia sp. NMBU_R16]NRO96471.1 DUF2894 domain-containing protein [Paraburkholderia sp. NMBU_R16]
MASEALDPASMLQAWRESGAHRVKPVRFRAIETLARRAADQTGEVRRLLDERIAELIDAYAVDLEKAAPVTVERNMMMTTTPDPFPRSALAELVDQMAANRAPSDRDRPATGDSARPLRFDPEPEALDYFRHTWSKLSTERRLRESHEQVPGNAGPLNSESLVYRSLSLMRELSPEYLRQFLGYVDALSWIEQLNESEGMAAKDGARPAPVKKSARGKSR